jgi:Asp-tRNA(Asn)/Glu-tRNA(Gln) amidotransferase B subunit
VKDAFKDEKAVHFLIGQLMKLSRGKVDPSVANEMIHQELDEIKSKNTI